MVPHSSSGRHVSGVPTTGLMTSWSQLWVPQGELTRYITPLGVRSSLTLHICEGKGKLHSRKTWVSGGVAPVMPSLDSRWSLSGQLHSAAILSPGKSSQCPMAGWAPKQVWYPWTTAESLATVENRTPNSQLSSPQLIIISTELSWLLNK